MDDWLYAPGGRGRGFQLQCIPVSQDPAEAELGTGLQLLLCCVPEWGLSLHTQSSGRPDSDTGLAPDLGKRQIASGGWATPCGQSRHSHAGPAPVPVADTAHPGPGDMSQLP